MLQRQHERAFADFGGDKTFVLELLIRLQHRGAIDFETRGQLAFGRQAVALGHRAGDDLFTQLGSQLPVHRHLAASIQLKLHGRSSP